MILLHCSVSLPRDYSVDRVRERVAAQAPELDSAPGLLLFAHGLRVAGERGIGTHRLAMAAVWSNTSRLAAYLWEPGGLERVRAQYGSVDVSLWSIAGLQIDRAKTGRADRLVIQTSAPDADTPLSALGAQAKDAADKALRSRDVHAAARGVDPGRGCSLAVDLRTGLPRDGEDDAFELLHLSVPPVG
ncbi:DUF4865 family protein [uncultured Demequina sp.]|uniref:DUF4865 family protein n=1 Tax=uncultured Demequina sp. TaxID=693499 RepID=UPI0025D3F521|nr:DUF4865 family protein [uncultured Demequina sp.]